MSPGRLVDLAQVRAARERLDAVMREHPECQGPRGPQNVRGWEAALEQDDKETMSNEPTIQCAFRLPESLVKKVDGFAERMGTEQPGVSFSRADAVRALLTRGLDAAGGAKGNAKKR